MSRSKFHLSGDNVNDHNSCMACENTVITIIARRPAKYLISYQLSLVSSSLCQLSNLVFEVKDKASQFSKIRYFKYYFTTIFKMELAIEYTASKTFTRKVTLPTGLHGAKVAKGNKCKTSPSCLRFLSPRGSCAVDPRYSKGKLAIKALMAGKETRMEWEPTEVYLSRLGGPLVWVPLFPWSPFGVVPAPAAFGGLVVQAPGKSPFFPEHYVSLKRGSYLSRAALASHLSVVPKISNSEIISFLCICWPALT